MSTLTPERKLTKCWKSNPAECRIHGSNAGFNALKDLMKAKETINGDLYTQKQYDEAANNLREAQGIYDATPEGLAELEKEIETADDEHKGLLEQRLNYVKALNSVEEAEASAKTEGGIKIAGADRDEQLKEIQEALEKGVAELSTSEGWQKYLESASKFHNYSFNNQMLIALQTNGMATQVASYRSWLNDHERQVEKGQKAIKILAPITYKKTVKNHTTGVDEEKSFTAFKAVPVFDISQTSGKDLPAHPAQLLEGEAPAGFIEELDKKIEDSGYVISYEEIAGGANGYTSHSGKVVIDSRLSPAQQAKTKAHELAHIKLGHMERDDYHTGPGGCRGDMEVEAESVAFIVSHARGLNSGKYSFGYITSWAGGNTDKLKKLGVAVSKGAKEILG